MATQLDALSLVYARSLYELADQAGGRAKIQEIADELEQICELARSDRAFAELLRSPIIDQRRRRDSLRKIFSNRVTDLALRFLLVLNAKGRLGALESIADAFDSLVQDAFGRVEVDIFTPTKLESDSLTRIHDRIKQALGKDPVLHPYTDPTMLGGIKLRIGDQLIDGSVASKLRRMRHALMTNGPTEVRSLVDRIIDHSGDTA